MLCGSSISEEPCRQLAEHGAEGGGIPEDVAAVVGGMEASTWHLVSRVAGLVAWLVKWT